MERVLWHLLHASQEGRILALCGLEAALDSFGLVGDGAELHGKRVRVAPRLGSDHRQIGVVEPHSVDVAVELASGALEDVLVFASEFGRRRAFEFLEQT